MKRIALTALLSLLVAGASAQPVKCVDASGKIRYIDESMVGAQKCEAVKDSMNVVGPQEAPPRGRLDETGEQRPSQSRPQALRNRGEQPEARLAKAEENLAQARKNLTEQEAIRLGEERNYARVQERLQPYQEAVERAERELEQLRRASR